MPSLIDRRLASVLGATTRSALLLGPRQTGKSTLMRSLAPDLEINLADQASFFEFAQNPRLLAQRLAADHPRVVFIDEVQRLPGLLNTVQALLDAPGRAAPRFLLTGSSARKLRRGHANLLPGRVHTYSLGPLAACELDYRVDVGKALAFGTLPGIYTEPVERDAKKTLRSYTATYLKEEVQAEALTRNIEGFARFLRVAAACAGSFLDVSKLASEAMVPRQTATRFFELLEDTLLVHRLDAFAQSERRRLVRHPKYVFFDNGVLNALLGTFALSADRLGLLFEHLVTTQVFATAAALDADLRLSTFRTEHGAEVDLVIEGEGVLWAVECKASENVGPADLRGFASFGDVVGRRRHRCVVAYLGETRRRLSGVDILPWQELLRELGSAL